MLSMFKLGRTVVIAAERMEFEAVLLGLSGDACCDVMTERKMGVSLEVKYVCKDSMLT